LADITMPQLGETVTEGTITRWIKQVGESVAEDEVLFEVSTDKVDSEVPSPVAGVVTEILVPAGDTVDVGTRLAVISDRGEPPVPAVPPAAAAEPQPEPQPEAQLPRQPASVDAAVPPAASEVGPSEPEPAAVPAASRRGGGYAVGPDGGNGGRLLSPVVRRLISEHHLDPAQIEGTGAGGRITRSDVLALIDRRNGGIEVSRQPGAAAVPSAAAGVSPPGPVAPPAPARPSAPAPPVVTAGDDRDTIVPFTNIRRRTAEHMVRSKHTSAHTMVAFEVDYSGVDRVRQGERNKFRETEGFGLTYLPFVTRAVVDALADFPHVNSSVGEDTLILHHDFNIGIAVDLDFEGLLVPVIHQADGKRLRVLAREIAGLATKARAKRLTMDDISGGTFTITNAGPFGTFITVPIINQPQVAILSTDGVRKRPVAIELPDGSDGIAVHPVGNLIMSWDHRAFDGAYAAAFLAAVKRIVETRDWSAEL
jgi:2-oxoglutarate dehydrogenase E2 component (dihydrolipoamide succinyltransferase)